MKPEAAEVACRQQKKLRVRKLLSKEGQDSWAWNWQWRRTLRRATKNSSFEMYMKNWEEVASAKRSDGVGGILEWWKADIGSINQWKRVANVRAGTWNIQTMLAKGKWQNIR